VAKRSPILGYNHNVLYRGLVFHVQTEDSGQLSPHLFTHLFHGGVIISTRKLVYDAGSAEDAIKGLMQSQHKIVLKDLKKGTFDDKIDAYLVGTEGLLPRTTPAGPAGEVAAPPPDEPPRLSTPEITFGRPGTEELEALDLLEPAEMIEDRPSEPVITVEPPPPVVSRTATPPPHPRAATPLPVQARTQTADRKSAPTSIRTSLPPPPPPEELDPPTLNDIDSGAISAAINATVKTPMANLDSAPEISIKLDLEEPVHDHAPQLARTRSKHDTDIQLPTELGGMLSDGVPGSIGTAPSSSQRAHGDSIPPLPAPPERRTGDRSAVTAGTLPPARPIMRPPSRQAITPPAVVSRPISAEDRSDAVEVYAPPPASAEPPPGERSERPGQYAQHKKPSPKLVDVVKTDRSGSVPIPSGLSPPRRTAAMPIVAPPSRTNAPSTPPASVRAQTPSAPYSQGAPKQPSGSYPVQQGAPKQPSGSYPVQQGPSKQPSGSYPVQQGVPKAPSGSHPVQQAKAPSGSNAAPRANTPSQPPVSGRTPTPSRVSPGSGPAQQRTGVQSGGVVMTRPAVIVGAPPKSTAPPRIRKAREEEGRGFGQGLISEKSLDEVILAYLSEDADDK
jgi:hypothetical protein